MTTITNAAPEPSRTPAPVIVATPYEATLTETFIRAHIERLPARVLPVSGWVPRVAGRAVHSWPRRAVYRAWREISGSAVDSATRAYLDVFRRYHPAAVLAEYGPMGVIVMAACREARVPLIVHFHGYDAHLRSVLAEHAVTYPILLRQAAAVIAVSEPMQQRLIALGAPPAKVHRNFCGVDCGEFNGGAPAEAPPAFIAVGRFIEKKAPDCTVRAFAKVHRVHPAATLRMVGDGPLLGECQRLARQLGVHHAVMFLGPQPASVVREALRRARCLVQHSVEAVSGDAEGTPISIIEAGACGLPVVATRHAGIRDVVVEGETGFLVDEHDVDGMSRYMLRIAEDPLLAAALGRAARQRVESHFTIEHSIGTLWRIIQACVRD